MEKKWRKGGYSCNGLRESTNVRNYFSGPGRMNLIPNVTTKSIFSPNDPVASIGVIREPVSKVLNTGSYGPGTLRSTNVQVRVPYNLTIEQQGEVHQNEKRSQYVDYRSTAPFLIEQLRQNPLSIYAVGDAKNKEIPCFYSYIQPDNYETYKSVNVPPDQQSIVNSINGNAQTAILGLGYDNPFMGLGQRVNDKPTFLGKSYGGGPDSARIEGNKLYKQGWTKAIINSTTSENCFNRALSEFAQGYNVAPQINQGKMYTYYGGNTNLPWSQLFQRGKNPPATQPWNTGYTNNVYDAGNRNQPRFELFSQVATSTPTTPITTTTTPTTTTPITTTPIAPTAITSTAAPTITAPVQPTTVTTPSITPTQPPAVPTQQTQGLPTTTSLVQQPNYNSLAAAIQNLEQATGAVLNAATRNISG
jgi:hypothetical protein